MNGGHEDVRERFLRAIAERLPPERVAEVHLFPPMQQGGQETGVAVIAAYRAVPALEAAAMDSGTAASGYSRPAERLDDSSTHRLDSGLLGDFNVPETVGAGPPPESQDTDNLHVLSNQSSAPASVSALDRLTVYRACYRWMRKGPDRGRWEIEVTEEADAPLGAVGNVVRGVYRRAGSGSEPERLSSAAFRAAVSDEPWKTGR